MKDWETASVWGKETPQLDIQVSKVAQQVCQKWSRNVNDAISTSKLFGSSPFLFPLQKFAVSIDLHVQSQFNIQQLFVLVQLMLHLGVYFSHLTVFVRQQLAGRVFLLSQRCLQLYNTITPTTSLNIDKEVRVWGDNDARVTEQDNTLLCHLISFDTCFNKNIDLMKIKPSVKHS